MTQTKDAVAKAPAPKRGEVISHPARTDATVARMARPKRRHRLIVASFLLAVIAPTVAAVGYLYLFAADQYASRMAFSVRSADAAPSVEFLGALTQSFSGAGSDAQVVFEFIRSQQAAEAAFAALPLAELYNLPERDVVFRLGENQPVEDILRYWRWMTDVSVDMGAGIVTFEARAFDAESARKIATFMLDESTRIVNALSEQAREDAVADARRVLGQAEERLRAVRRDIRAFRNIEQELDPSENARASLGLMAALEARLADAQIELDTQVALVGSKSAQIPVLRQRVASIEARIAEERARIGDGLVGDAANPDDRAFADRVARYEELVVDREFAQNAYIAALASFEQAQVEARRQTRYLAPHIRPTLSQDPEYPQRALMALAVFAVAAVVWAVMVLVLYNIRDRR